MNLFKFIWIVILSIGFVHCASSEPTPHKVALLIGNADYINGALTNPIHDATDMAQALQQLGFDVVLKTNLKSREIGSTLREFRLKLKSGDVALVFYAGHGLQINGENYLPAVDAEINSEEDVPNQSLAIKQIMDVLEQSKTSMNLVFLDACRNNPLKHSFRDSARGLARVDAPSGTLISFATRPGSVAADGNGRNGLYTSELLRHLSDQNLPVESMLKRVFSAVRQASHGRQEPWIEGGIDGDFYFSPATTNQGTLINSITANARTPLQIEDEFWSNIQQSAKYEDFQAYLVQYPNGRYVPIAKLKSNQLNPSASPANINSSSATINRVELAQPHKINPAKSKIGTITNIDNEFGFATIANESGVVLNSGDSVMVDTGTGGVILTVKRVAGLKFSATGNNLQRINIGDTVSTP